MNFNNKFLCFGLLFCIKSTLNSPVEPKSNRNYDVDEFCDKLLSSNKFERLIERVAAKAAEKMTEINNHEVNGNFNKLKRADKNDIYENESEVKTEKPNEESAETKKAKYIASKMALLKNNSIPPLNDLSLQYKRFVKGSHKAFTLDKSKIVKSQEAEERATDDKESKETKDKLIHHKDQRGDKFEDTHEDKYDDEHEDKHEKSGEKNEIKYKNGESLERDENKSESQDHSNEKLKHQSNEKEQDPHSVSHERVNSTSKKDRETDDKNTKEESSQENVINKSNESKVGEKVVKKNSKQSDKANKVGYSVEVEHSVETYNKKDLVPKTEALPETTTKKKLEPILRREGDKVYTYQVSSDYDDYHEQLQKEKTKRNKKPKSKSKSQRKSLPDSSF